MQKIAVLIICQSVLLKSFLWNQELFFSILLSPPYPLQQWPERKLDSGKPLPVEPLGAPGRDPAGNNSPLIVGLHPLAGPLIPAVEGCAPTNEEVPLVLVAKPQATTWVGHIVHFLQTGELAEDQEEAERVAQRASMYQFVNDTLYRRQPNGVKLKCI